ncbi:MAG: MBL fold metallo-hydrolase [Candidatus Hydrogenedentes bacterium]|nr:MBL fold metallo-hydrolase [Candidatus Hydrogenedentota bacterium]
MALGITALVFCAALSAEENAAAGATPLAPGVYMLEGAVKTGVLVRDGRALLIDCCETVSMERLRALGVEQVEMICMTQHRRPNVMGAYRFVEEQSAQAVVAEKDRALFEDVDAYWNDWHNRWHLYHFQPGPQVLPRRLPVSRIVIEGDTIKWRGLTLRVIETPGATEGAISYVVDVEGKSIAFIGDVMCGPGQIWDLYSLQKGFRKVGDYHGFLGMREPLIESLHKLTAAAPVLAVPSHGATVENFTDAAALLEERLNALNRNFVSISALNHYFPSQFEDMKDDPARMPRAEQLDPPAWIRRVAYTSFAVVADSGDALLIDCGHDSVLAKIDEWQKAGTVKSLEGCWVTHYHDDHVDSLFRLATRYCPIMTDARMAEVLEFPHRYFLPCIGPTPVPVARKTADGESWTWREFTLTAFHFPGQTLYHGGLLVEGHGAKVFFAGDSGAPTGLDDYCAQNRTFLGAGRGSRRCLDIWRTTKPDYIFNEHQDKAFHFTDAQLDHMEQTLAAREEMVKAMVPWDAADFALDEHWVRTYPYEQDAAPGDSVTIQVHVTNHGNAPLPVTVEPRLPQGWSWEPNASRATAEVPARTDGWVTPGATHPDAVLSVLIRIPSGAQSGLYVIPFSVDFREWRLGAIRHALVRVR